MSDNAELQLGIVPEKTKDCQPCCPSEQSDQPVYPTLTFNGQHAILFNDKYGPFQTDDEITLTIRTKIKKFSMGPEKWDQCVELCALAIVGDVVEEEASEEPAEEASEKPVVRGMSGAKTKKPAEKY